MHKTRCVCLSLGEALCLTIILYEMTGITNGRSRSSSVFLKEPKERGVVVGYNRAIEGERLRQRKR